MVRPTLIFCLLAVAANFSAHATDYKGTGYKPRGPRVPQVPPSEQPAVSAGNAADAGAGAAGANTQVGGAYGTGLNQNVSKAAPENVAKYNQATQQGMAIDGMVHDLQDQNYILPEDALALQTALAMQMLAASQKAASAGGTPTNYQAASDPGQAMQADAPANTSSPITISGDSTIPAVNLGDTSGYEIPNTISEPTSNTANLASGTAPTTTAPATNTDMNGAVMILPTSSGTAGSNAAAASQVQGAGNGKVVSVESTQTHAPGSGSMGQGLVANPPKDDSDTTKPLDSKTVAKLSESLAKLKNVSKAGAKTADAGTGNSAAANAEGLKPGVLTVVPGDAGADKFGAYNEEGALWPDAIDHKVMQVGSAISKMFGIDIEPQSAASTEPVEGSIAGSMRLSLLVLLSLAALGLSTRKLLRTKRLQAFAEALRRRFGSVTYVLEHDREFKMEITEEKGSWVVGMRHKRTGHLEKIGTPADGAVFFADCLPTSERHRLGLELGLERALYSKRLGFKKTNDPVNPAIRPFAEKVALVEKSGLAKKAS